MCYETLDLWELCYGALDLIGTFYIAGFHWHIGTAQQEKREALPCYYCQVREEVQAPISLY